MGARFESDQPESERMRAAAAQLRSQGRTRDALKLELLAAKQERKRKGAPAKRGDDGSAVAAVLFSVALTGVGVALVHHYKG